MSIVSSIVFKNVCEDSTEVVVPLSIRLSKECVVSVVLMESEKMIQI